MQHILHKLKYYISTHLDTVYITVGTEFSALQIENRYMHLKINITSTTYIYTHTYICIHTPTHTYTHASKYVHTHQSYYIVKISLTTLFYCLCRNASFFCVSLINYSLSCRHRMFAYWHMPVS